MLRHVAGLLLIFLLPAGCGDDSKSTGGGDVIPPAAVTDLAATALTDSSLLLVWTAPGDDDTIGTASLYDLRLSTRPDTLPDWWDSLCTAADSVRAPRPAGAPESLLVRALEADTLYYFALRTSDEVPNWSDLSNIVVGRTSGPANSPDTIPPRQVTDLAILSTTSSSVTLTWSAPGDDGTVGIATYYDLRYSLDSLDDSRWETGEIPPNLPPPRPSGEAEVFTISDLPSHSTYYFSVRAVDEAGNVAPPSNNAIRHTEASEDTIPPARVPYVYAASRGSGGVFLAWIAPGDDGIDGRASGYQVRHSAVMIDDATWSAATAIHPVPSPSPAGSLDTMTARGVPIGWRFFALRAFDEAANGSSISDVAIVYSGFTPVDTEATDTIPPSRIEDLRLSRLTEREGQLVWTAPGDDGDEGTAAEYEVRWDTTEAAVELWVGAATMPPPPPLAGGTQQVLDVAWPDGHRKFYFGIRTKDWSGNWSPVSNIVHVTPPVLLVSQDTLSFGDRDTLQLFSLRCAGDGRIYVRIRTEPPWLTAEPQEILVSEAEVAVAVRVDREGLPFDLYSGLLRILTPSRTDSIVAQMTCGSGWVRGRVYELADWERWGHIYASVPRGVGGATVSIGSSEAATDDSGRFSLEGMVAGDQPLRVSAPYFHEIDSTLALLPPQNLDLLIEPIRFDYFPLQVGNRFEYSFSEYRYDGGVFRSSGTETWVVESITTDEAGDTLFSIRTHKEGTWAYGDNPENPFEGDGTLSIRLSANRIEGPFPGGMLVRRYYPAYSPDTLRVLGSHHFPESGTLMWMERGVGPTSWGDWHTSAHTAHHYAHTLLDWDFGE